MVFGVPTHVTRKHLDTGVYAEHSFLLVSYFPALGHYGSSLDRKFVLLVQYIKSTKCTMRLVHSTDITHINIYLLQIMTIMLIYERHNF